MAKLKNQLCTILKAVVSGMMLPITAYLVHRDYENKDR